MGGAGTGWWYCLVAHMLKSVQNLIFRLGEHKVILYKSRGEQFFQNFSDSLVDRIPADPG